MFTSMDAALEYIFKTRRRLDGAPRGLDEYTRDVTPTRSLLDRAQLLRHEREYIVVTGSRGKGSVTAIMAKLLAAQGHRVGTISSPHLVHWNERIRVDGHMIATADFLRILADLQPAIDGVVAYLADGAYLSPQGIFLAIALRYFDETGVDVAVLEVGRGGRFDDIAVVPNKLAVFTPIMLEHRSLLGGSLERIAWHKAGIIKPGCAAVSLPQAPATLAQLQAEAALQGANLTVLDESQLARRAADRADGQLIQLDGYGELFLPLLGRYQVENAGLAIRAAEAFAHEAGRAAPSKAVIQRGLARVKWLGRAQQLDREPAVYVDGAITVPSAESFVDSLRGRLSEPVVSIVGVPSDRDYAGVYNVMASVSDALIITETDINPNTRFPPRERALAAAKTMSCDVAHAARLPEALELARGRAGASGTILLAVSLMLVGECMLIWNIDTTTI